MESHERIFFTKIAFEGDISSKELEDFAENLGILSSRRTSDQLQKMKKKGMIKQGEIKKHKKRWTINEEELGDFIDIWATVGKNTKKEPILFTQSEVTKSIKIMIKDYEKKIANKKSDVNKKFIFAHIIYIVNVLSWIARLSLSINAGFFINAPAKTTLAQENIKLFENFLQKLCRNMAEKDPESYGVIIALISNYLEELNPFEEIPIKKQSIS